MKRILSILLVICMMVTMFPVSALAETRPPENNTPVGSAPTEPTGEQAPTTGETASATTETTEQTSPEESTEPTVETTADAQETQETGILVMSLRPDTDTYYTYIFQGEDGQQLDTQTVKSGDTLHVPAAPALAHKRFLGWYDGSSPFTGFGLVGQLEGENRTITITAKYETVFYVFFKDHHGNVIVTKEGTDGETISAADVSFAVEVDEAITGWSYAGGTIQPSGGVVIQGEDITLNARVEKGFWITFDSQGGTYIAPQFVTGSPTVPAAPTRPGYTFAGWYVGSAAQDISSLTEATTVTAKWTPNTNTPYTVIHWWQNANDDGYSAVKTEKLTGTTGELTQAMVMTKGENVAHVTAKKIDQAAIAGDGSTIIHIQYDRKEYTIYFRKENSDSNDYGTIKARWGKNIRSSFNTKSTTAGTALWSERKDGDDPWTSFLDEMPTENRVYYAHSNGNKKCSATYYGENLEGTGFVVLYTSTVMSSGSLYVTDEDKVEIKGFTYRDKLNGKTSTPNDSLFDGAKFYYKRNSYTIRFISGGSEIKSVAKKYEAAISDANFVPSTPPTGKENYVFAGWYNNEACGGSQFKFDGKMPAENITLYAKWVPPVYTVTVRDVDGTDLTAFQVPLNETVDESAMPKDRVTCREGESFIGWVLEDGTPFHFETKITKDYILTAKVGSNQTYCVTYNANGGTGSVTDGEKYAEGSFAVVKSADGLTAPQGKVFLGWTRDDGAQLHYPGSSLIMVEDIVLYALWGDREATVSVTYHSNFGQDQTHTVNALANNEKITIAGCMFTRTGYTFTGWKDGNGENFAAGQEARVDQNGSNDLYAQWRANTDTRYTVEFYYQNENGSYPNIANASQIRTGTTGEKASVTAADKTARENGRYVFDAAAGNVESGFIAPDGSLVLKLYFKRNAVKYNVEFYYQTDDGKYPAKADETESRDGFVGKTAEVTAADKANKKNNQFVLDTTAENVFSQEIKADGTTTLKLYFARNAVKYNVEFYYQTDDGNYPAKADETESRDGFAGKTAEVTAADKANKKNDQFVLDTTAENVFSQEIKADGTTTLKLYFARNAVKYNVEFYYQTDDGNYPAKADETESRDGFAGKTAEVTAADKANKKNDQFVLDTSAGNVFSQEIKADGTTTLKLYFARNAVKYNVEFYYQTDDGNYPAKADETESRDGFVGKTAEATTADKANKKNNQFVLDTTAENVFSQEIKADGTTTLKLYFARNAVKYNVEFYYQTDDGNYPAKADETESRDGFVGKTAEATTADKANKKNDQFVLDTTAENVFSQEIKADGTTTLKLYFARNAVKYNVEFYYQTDDGKYPAKADETESRDGFAGKTAEVTAADKANKKNDQFVLDTSADNIFSQEIKADGSTTLKLYFARNAVKYNVEFYYQTDDGNYPAKADETDIRDGLVGKTAEVTAADKANKKNNQFVLDTTAENVFSQEIKADGTTTLKLYFARNAVKYNVEFYYQTDDGNYPAKADETESRDGFVGKTAEVTAADKANKKNDQFVLDTSANNIFSQEIKADGTTTLKLYFARNAVKYNVEFYYQTDDGNYPAKADETESRDGFVGKTAEVTAADKANKKNDQFVLDTSANNIFSQEIKADGTTTLKLYFARNAVKYNVEFYYQTDDGKYPAKADETESRDGFVGKTAEATTADKANKKNDQFVLDTSANNIFSQEIKADGTTTLKLYFARNAVKYNVEFYYQTDDGNYPTKADETESRDGFVGKTAEVTAADKADKKDGWFTLDPDGAHVLYQEIKADGSTTLKLYFKPAKANFIVHYYLNGTTQSLAEDKTGTGTVGQEVTEAPIAISGYTPVSQENQILPIAVGANEFIFYYYQNVALKANSASYVFNGKEQKVEGFTGAPEDAQFQIIVGAAGTYVGNYPATFPVDAVGTVDDTRKYLVTEVADGNLEIKPVTSRLLLAGESGIKTYDGNYHALTEFTVANLPEGCTLTGVTYLARGKNIGQYPGAFAGQAAIHNENGEDITRYFTLSYEEGLLRIEPAGKKVILTGESASRNFTGKYQELTGYDVEGLPEGCYLMGVSYLARGKAVGKYPGEFSGDVVIYNEAHEDVTDFFTVEYAPGLLRIVNPDKDGPKTGDFSHALAWMALLMLSGGTLAGTMLLSARRGKKRSK